MKKILLLFIVICFSQTAFASMVLQGAAQYNVESALNEVKEDVQYKINPALFAANLLDYNRNENMTAMLNGQVELKDRTLAYFSVGTYGVTYKNDPLHAYYYSNSGVLEYVDVRTSQTYPYKSYQYDMSGKLVNMGLRISKGETYIYNPAGKLMAHWVGANGYDEAGRVIMTRKFVE